jgi:hypothetical protein
MDGRGGDAVVKISRSPGLGTTGIISDTPRALTFTISSYSSSLHHAPGLTSESQPIKVLASSRGPFYPDYCAHSPIKLPSQHLAVTNSAHYLDKLQSFLLAFVPFVNPPSFHTLEPPKSSTLPRCSDARLLPSSSPRPTLRPTRPTASAGCGRSSRRSRPRRPLNPRRTPRRARSFLKRARKTASWETGDVSRAILDASFCATCAVHFLEHLCRQFTRLESARTTFAARHVKHLELRASG